MLPIDTLRTGFVNDFEPGTVVAYRKDESYALGLVVNSDRKDTTPGVLHLGFFEQQTEKPYFDQPYGSCVGLVSKPLWRWSGNPALLQSARRGYPRPGHLVIDGTSRLVSGTDKSQFGDKVYRYWDLATGDAVTSFPNTETAVFVLEWQIGLLDIEGTFRTLVDFKVQRPE